MTVLFALASMWAPICLGLLQGRQDFLWLGWATISNGVGRFVAMCVIVLLLSGLAAGAMAAVFVGTIGTVTIGFWRTRYYWKLKPEPVVWRAWFKRVVPLTLGLGASTFMLSADMIFVQH